MKKSRISEVLSGLIDLIVAGLLWILCSLPVITIGASSTALYYAVVKCVRHNRGRLTPTFFFGFRSNVRQASLIWLLFLAYLLVGLADAYAIGRMGFGPNSILHHISRLFFLLPLLLFPWVFAFISRFQNTVGGTLKFCGWLALRYPGKTLVLTLELIGFLLISWLMPPIIPILPGILCLLLSITIEPLFKTLHSDDDRAPDPWYNE